MPKTIEDSDAALAAEILRDLENYNGEAWVAPWDRMSGFPLNPLTGKGYGGSYNSIILMIMGSRFGDSRFAGFGQWRNSKNPIKKGEKGFHIYFPTFSCSSCSARVGRGDTCKKCKSNLKAKGAKRMTGFGSSVVFNNQQTENPLPAAQSRKLDTDTGFEQAAKIIGKAGADLRFGGGRAYYSPREDYIQMPDKDSFHTPEGFWATNFHEHAHWTGHASRLGRKGITDPTFFGSPKYAYEELVAEIASSFLCKHVGIEKGGIDGNHIAYIANWRKAIGDDPSIIRRATGDARSILTWMTK